MTPADVKLLRKARQLLRKGWTQGVTARDCYDNKVPSTSPHASQFCVFGALEAASPLDTPRVHSLSRILMCIAGQSLMVFNDAEGREYREVDALFTRTIALGDILFPTNYNY